MILNVQMKQAGRKINRIITSQLVLASCPSTIRELVTFTVIAMRNAYQEKLEHSRLAEEGQVSHLMLYSQEQLQDMGSTGKIGFGILPNDKLVSEQEAIDTALQAFEDGIVTLFIDGKRYESLEGTICLTGTETLTFVKMVMLAGRMW